jgi:hypothetical protein
MSGNGADSLKMAERTSVVMDTPIAPKMDVQVSSVEERILENRRVKIRRRPFHNNMEM